MSLYPSLEDMKYDHIIQAQNAISNSPAVSSVSSPVEPCAPSAPILYPSLNTYMGLDLPQTTPLNTVSNQIAPLSSNSVGLWRARPASINGIRQVVLCKDKEGKIGIRVRNINNGLFVCFVKNDSPAALAGVRFGDQILQINGENVAGFSVDKAHTMFKKSSINGIEVVIRDRPLERTVTLHKCSLKTLGFQFQKGKIVAIVKDSSAARNGLLTDHQLVEINGQNVVGVKDEIIRQVIDNAGDVVTVTIIPSFLYEHMIKKMSTSLVKDFMDHSIPVF